MQEQLIQVAAGKGKADLLIKNGRVVNVFTGQVERKDVAIYQGAIVGLGDYAAEETLDVRGSFLCPGLIDGHLHIESSLVTIPEFARAVLPHGTTTVIIDPHEIANVLGAQGVRFMAESAEGVPFNVFIMIPSCVPATNMETSGATLTAEDISLLLKEPWSVGLGEMMNFPGVISRDADVLKKIEAAKGWRIDGHAPSLMGKGLSAYILAGIRSDHECTTAKEAKQKLAQGMWIMIREGSAARNLRDLVGLVNPVNSRRFFFVTDDRHPRDLLNEGHIDFLVRQAIRLGLNPILAIQMATLNAAEYYRLDDLGAIAPGYRADLVVFDHLSQFEVKKVIKDGQIVADRGRMVPLRGKRARPYRLSGSNWKRVSGSIRIAPIKEEDLVLRSQTPVAKVIELIPDQIVTKKVIRKIILENEIALPDPNQDILKLVVVERHHATGNIGIGLVQGFGMKRGALGSSVAHDSHNLVVVGTCDRDIFEAIQSIERMGGGLTVVADGKVLASLPLPVAGLMAEAPVARVARQMEILQRAAKRLGCRVADPFMTLSFLSLPVIPELKLTDKGLVDVTQFKIVPLFGAE